MNTNSCFSKKCMLYFLAFLESFTVNNYYAHNDRMRMSKSRWFNAYVKYITEKMQKMKIFPSFMYLTPFLELGLMSVLCWNLKTITIWTIIYY